MSSVIPPLRRQNPPPVCLQFLKQAEAKKVDAAFSIDPVL